MSNATASYSNPIDGKTYTAPGGWTTYQPEGGVRRSKDRIQNGGVRLMTASSAVSERTTVESLAAFIERIEGTAQKTLESTVDEATILAQFTCTPGEFTVELAHQGTISEELLNRFYKQLNLLSPLSVSSAEVVFQVTIGIENGR